MNQKQRGRFGFTLIEVLLCTAILSVSLILVYKPMLSALDAFRYSDEREEADRLLEKQIFEFREKIPKFRGVVSPSETRTLLGRNKPFEYRRVAKSLTSDGELYRMECQVSWTRAGNLKRLLRSFDVYIPKYSAV